MLALPFTPPERRAGAALHVAPHVMIYRHFVRSTDTAAPRRRAPQRKPRTLWAIATFSEKPRHGATLSLNFVLSVSQKRAMKIAEEKARAANPRNYNFQSILADVPDGLMQAALDEGSAS